MISKTSSRPRLRPTCSGCQEAINNITKHSLATQVSLTIKRQDGRVDFCIKDNGLGFDLEQFREEDLSEKGMGVASMDERLRMIGGHLAIASQMGMGTEISFSIPCDANWLLFSVTYHRT
jgi:two-component system sensor histidine kinase DegS